MTSAQEPKTDTVKSLRRAHPSQGGVNTEFRHFIEDVRRAAESAAWAAVDDALVAREVAEAVVEKLEDRLLKGRVPDKPVAWGRTVGRREALRRARQKTVRLPEGESADGGSRHREAGTLPSLFELRRVLNNRRPRLTAKQSEAVEAGLEHGSIKRAARALGKDPSGFRRLFHRALDRLRRS
jgi:DNA-directed RNA polymerase specialized sigma24 family protein